MVVMIVCKHVDRATISKRGRNAFDKLVAAHTNNGVKGRKEVKVLPVLFSLFCFPSCHVLLHLIVTCFSFIHIWMQFYVCCINSTVKQDEYGDGTINLWRQPHWLQCLQGAKVRNWTPNQIIKAG
jgi:hypothetical protein